MFLCIKLLEAFIANGLEYIVLCPGSRSGPLALAAGDLSESKKVKLITSIDERSAAFLALGISTATGKATAVITTSGTAVGNLLPASIESDRSCQPLLLITADRPERLKNCGSNQTVNQEEFLKSVCRSFEQTPSEGIHHSDCSNIRKLASQAWQKAHKNSPGPVHLNIPFEEPLHASSSEQKELVNSVVFNSEDSKKIYIDQLNESHNGFSNEIYNIDLAKPGIIIVGPWRGKKESLKAFKETLKNIQLICGWPIFADPLSGIDSKQPGLIYNWELLIDSGFLIPEIGLEVLRLGTLPSSRLLIDWLKNLGKNQLLISECDYRYLDPLLIANQWNYGLESWWVNFSGKFIDGKKVLINNFSNIFLNQLLEKDYLIDSWLEEKIKLIGMVNEPSLARWIPRLLPAGFNLMLSSSSPVRDWITYGGKASFSGRCFAFRGASGIDGTLSLAMGLSMVIGRMVLITGDLALLHDSNGWLFANSYKPPLIVLLIDNQGGGIFSQLGIEEINEGNLKKLFKMPQSVDPLALASAYGVPYRQISCLEDLESAFDWGFSNKGPVLLRVCTCSESDNNLRNEIRNELKNYFQNLIKNKAI